MKLRALTNGGYVFWCPGCDSAHSVNSNERGPQWTFTGSWNAPTFRPSILVTYDGADGKRTCHSFVTSGDIQFLSDCTHALAGQTVPIPDWPHAPGTYSGIQEEAP